jgi:hypothetical protein
MEDVPPATAVTNSCPEGWPATAVARLNCPAAETRLNCPEGWPTAAETRLSCCVDGCPATLVAWWSCPDPATAVVRLSCPDGWPATAVARLSCPEEWPATAVTRLSCWPEGGPMTRCCWGVLEIPTGDVVVVVGVVADDVGNSWWTIEVEEVAAAVVLSMETGRRAVRGRRSCRPPPDTFEINGLTGKPLSNQQINYTLVYSVFNFLSM